MLLTTASFALGSILECPKKQPVKLYSHLNLILNTDCMLSYNLKQFKINFKDISQFFRTFIMYVNSTANADD